MTFIKQYNCTACEQTPIKASTTAAAFGPLQAKRPRGCNGVTEPLAPEVTVASAFVDAVCLGSLLPCFLLLVKLQSSLLVLVAALPSCKPSKAPVLLALLLLLAAVTFEAPSRLPGCSSPAAASSVQPTLLVLLLLLLNRMEGGNTRQAARRTTFDARVAT
jgi:hypothetical protein